MRLYRDLHFSAFHLQESGGAVSLTGDDARRPVVSCMVASRETRRPATAVAAISGGGGGGRGIAGAVYGTARRVRIAAKRELWRKRKRRR